MLPPPTRLHRLITYYLIFKCRPYVQKINIYTYLHRDLAQSYSYPHPFALARGGRVTHARARTTYVRIDRRIVSFAVAVTDGVQAARYPTRASPPTTYTSLRSQSRRTYRRPPDLPRPRPRPRPRERVCTFPRVLCTVHYPACRSIDLAFSAAPPRGAPTVVRPQEDAGTLPFAAFLLWKKGSPIDNG